ncbi:membrane protein [Polymorphobacter multimanifer]|uniref:Uncharacterized protein (DUF983 family) n=1 Tax=Polymorphobacter multimanifer TaxID=1070431 RepID=A0A841L5D0_9SPHN|nr:DUF983 domain-containing protein [Polymorphobacter multimanifer]MBB6227630.1 uncharacterized protein (DUF983 family) [Polymorphobacter multimanifer]GGI75008.1 membrane protein [Polymorphobacter multimanifer]
MADLPPRSAVQHGLRGRCPRCGEGALFAGPVAYAPACTACGLDYSSFNVGDGAAAFLILIVGAVITGLALWLELSREPPWWVHALLWLPLTLGLSLGLMRLAKGVLLGIEYQQDAREGRQ